MQRVSQDSLHPGPGQRQEEDSQEGLHLRARGGLQHHPKDHCQGGAQEGGKEIPYSLTLHLHLPLLPIFIFQVGKKVCHSTKVDYGHQSSSYHEPSTSYHSESSYSSGPDYKQSSDSYGAPQATGYNAPSPPSNNYNAPANNDYKAPVTSYKAPDDYGAPPSQAPTTSYGLSF